MSCASIPFQTIQNLPYDRLKDLCENHETFSSAEPEVQSMLCEHLSKEQKREPFEQSLIENHKVSEIVHAIACEAIQKGEVRDQRSVLSMATGWGISATNAAERMAIAEKISPFLLLEAMEECACQAKHLEGWVKEDKSRSEAAEAILTFLAEPSSSLDLWDYGVTSLPEFVSKKGFHRVRSLVLSRNKLKKFPELSAFNGVIKLSLFDNEISTVPEKGEGINLIEELSLTRNQITSVPDNLIGFQSLRIFWLADNQIRAIPKRVFFPDSLKELALNNNQISVIPEDSEGLEKVKKLFLGHNEITELPGKLKGLEGLEFLSLSGNKILKLPETIEGLSNLKVLRLSVDPTPSIESLRARGLRSLELFNP